MKNRVIKNIFTGLFCLVLPVLLHSCKTDEENHDVKTDMTISSSSDGVVISTDKRIADVVIAPTGSSVDLTINSSVDWELEEDADDTWCVVAVSGNTVSISAVEFISDYTHKTTIRIVEKNRVVGSIAVTQSGTEVVELELDKSEVVFNEMGGVQTVTVTTNKEWTITGYEDLEWLEVDKGEDSFTLTTITNEVAREFTTTLTISSGTELNNTSVDVEVTLESWSAAYITPDRSMVIIPEEGGTVIVNVDSNRKWEATSNQTWVTVVQKSQTTLEVKAAASTGGVNEAVISFSSTSGRDSATAKSTVKQFVNPFILEYTISADNTTVAVPLMGNANCYVDWGDGEGTGFSGNIASFIESQLKHEYLKKGTYNVKMYGVADGIKSLGNSSYVTAILAWGDVLGATSLDYAFSGTSIKTIPAGYEDFFPRIKSFYGAFRACTKLTEIPADLFNNIDFAGKSGSVLTAVFYGCTAIKEIPGTLFDGATNITSFASTFRGMTSLKEIPGNLFTPFAAQLRDLTTTFAECPSLTQLPAELFAECVNLGGIYGVFLGCTGLTSLPVGMFDNVTKLTDVGAAFSGCTKLTGESPYTIVNADKVHLYERSEANGFTVISRYSNCFKGCTNLTDYSSMPENWRAYDNND